MNVAISDEIHAADLSSYEDVRELTGDIDKILWVLMVAEDIGARDGLSSGDIERVLLDDFSIHLPRQRIVQVVKRNSTYVLHRSRGGKGRIKLLDSGRKKVAKAGNSPILIEPVNAFSGRRQVQAFFEGLIGDVRICDPYIDPSTLDYIARVAVQNSVNLLTMVVNKEAEFRRDLAAFNVQRGRLEVRRSTAHTLHDRYVIDDKTIFMLGTSLNGLGKRQSIIVELGWDFRSVMIPAFDTEWNNARMI